MFLQDEAAQLTHQLRAMMGAYTQVKAEVDAHRGGWQVSASHDGFCLLPTGRAGGECMPLCRPRPAPWMGSDCYYPTWYEAAQVKPNGMLQ